MRNFCGKPVLALGGACFPDPCLCERTSESGAAGSQRAPERQALSMTFLLAAGERIDAA